MARKANHAHHIKSANCVARLMMPFFTVFWSTTFLLSSHTILPILPSTTTSSQTQGGYHGRPSTMSPSTTHFLGELRLVELGKITEPAPATSPHFPSIDRSKLGLDFHNVLTVASTESSSDDDEAWRGWRCMGDVIRDKKVEVA